MKADTINRENIHQMVMGFYTKVLDDEIVGPFFIAKLGEDMQNEHWKPHLALLVDFWSSIALGENSYRGNPFMPHTQLGELNREVFERWLSLFWTTLDEIYIPSVAAQFKERSSIIAGNFMRNLGIV
jgi:hemoglobin